MSGCANLRYLNPFPKNLGDVLSRYENIIIPENNSGQLAKLIRSEFLIDAKSICKVQGRTFRVDELVSSVIGTAAVCEGGVAMSSNNGDAVTLPQYTPKDFTSDQDVRWCPGCGDYAVLTGVRKALPKLGHRKEDYVFVSGIGCAARFPYYMDTYGMHTIHGRSLSVATGIKLANPELKVCIASGDGDLLSIGASHTVHTMRRNLDITILLLNNQIYGLTKGQYSPTSESGKVTKSTPMGSPDEPLNPIAMAVASGCSFIARTLDVDLKLFDSVYLRAMEHKGTSFVEIYQDCNIFNHEAFFYATQKETRPDNTVMLEHGKPLDLRQRERQGHRARWARSSEL